MRLPSVLRRVLQLSLMCIVATAPVEAQRDSARARTALPTVRITATRDGPRAPLELPYAITTTAPDSLIAARRLGVDELLFAIPGVALANRQNPAQDPRVSIRGFGARSAFGVRGVRVLQDGVPVTLADGQTPVDALDVEGARRVDVVRGSASSLYGNAAGGVIDIRSAAPALAALAPTVRITGGDDAPTVSALGAAGTLGAVGYTASATRVNGPGYRDYSDQRATRGALRLLLSPDASAGTAIVVAARISDVTRADSPGALTRSQLDINPRQADALSVRKQAGKTVRQADVSLTASRTIGAARTLDATLFGSARTLANPLTFATVDVDRQSGGASLRVNDVRDILSHGVRLGAGADIQWLRDDRSERENCIDAIAITAACPQGAAMRGARRKDQREMVTSVGPYLRAEVALTPALLASAGVRADAVRFEVQDHLVTSTNPDDSGDRTLRATSPSLGLVWRANPLTSLYANISRSFETPTTTELGNKPDGSAGINPELAPQRTTSIEVGAKGVAEWAPLRWDVALFDARARDELVPFDIVNGGGRRYYRNAGRTARRGAEVGAEAEAGAVSVRGSYTNAHYRYVDYVVGSSSFAGNRIPGIPEQALALAATLRRNGVTYSATADMAGALDVDDANSAQAAGRTLLGIAISGAVDAGAVRLLPLVALQNLAGMRSVGSVSVNATGGKFYEPAPGRVLLVRVAVAGKD